MFLFWGPSLDSLVNRSEDKAAWPLWPQGAQVFHARLLVFHEHAPTPGTKSGSTANDFTPSLPIFRSSRCLASESPSARSKNFKRLSTVTAWSYFRLFRWNSRVYNCNVQVPENLDMKTSENSFPTSSVIKEKILLLQASAASSDQLEGTRRKKQQNDISVCTLVWSNDLWKSGETSQESRFASGRYHKFRLIIIAVTPKTSRI